LLALIEVEPDLTLDEVVYAMRKQKIPGCRTAVWQFFQRHKIVFKKSLRGRTYCTGTPEDYAAVHAIQDQYKLVPLSAYGKPYCPMSRSFPSGPSRALNHITPRVGMT
jgi:hypothetical protein